MPFNGSGSYSAPASTWNPAVTSTTINSTDWTALLADFTTAFSLCMTKDGQQTPTANLTMGGFKLTSLGAGTLVSDAVRLSQVQNSSLTYLTAVAGTNTVTATATPTPAAYVVGQQFTFVPAVTNTAATTMNVSSLGAGAVQSAGVGLVGGELVAGIPVIVEVSAATPIFQIVGGGQVQPLVDTSLCQGRLTLTTAVPVTTSDVTAAETLFWTPYKGNRVALYTGTMWKLYPFSELSVDIPDATQMNDVFVYDNSGTLTLDVVAWSTDTARATALVSQNGVLVKSGATGRRYLGSFYSTTAGNGQTEDSIAKRYLWNYYNRVLRAMRVVESTDTWTYTLLAYQQARATATNQLDLVIGVSEDVVVAQVFGRAANDNANVRLGVGIGVDSTTVNSAQLLAAATTAVVNTAVNPHAAYRGFPGIGKHILPWLEISQATGTTTWQGDGGAPTDTQSGIFGEVWS